MSKPAVLLRWSMKRAGEEFNFNRDKLVSLLKQSGELPGEDGMFSTRQIVNVIFGGTQEKHRRAQIESTLNDAALKKTKNEILQKKFVPIDLVEKVWSDRMVDFRQHIQSLNLPQKDRNEILNELQNIPIAAYFNSSVKVNNDEDKEEME